MTVGKVEQYLANEVKRHGTVCLPLIDSENSTDAASIAKKVEELGASAVLVGGSSATDQFELAKVVSDIKDSVKIPVILFPGNVTGVSPRADAILFSSLLNSEDPYFITGAQALGAIAVKKHRIEPLPTAYIIVGEGTAAWFVGRARGIPFHKPNLAVMYSLAAQYMGMRFVYLEAGSGAAQNVPAEMVAAVRKHYDGTLIVGGGIKTPEMASAIAKAGADIIVVGTMIEKDGNWQQKLSSMISSMRQSRS
ncbi:MAG: geranylgeranylglyceryl/heptaprenylglyceryl phosphate synthase [Nitrososphaera sp.]|uniref:geranylgeranylglyceryl/heptaprenylglyceryl phosphate synthase n=1 Tax=Nitrososphaera sp. TaxID=1971748 RepID=UPI003D6EAC1A